MVKVILDAAGMPTVELHEDMKGEAVDMTKRGPRVNQELLRDAVASAALLPDFQTGDVLRRHMGLYLGRPVIDSRGLTDVHPVIQRVEGKQTYDILIPPASGVMPVKRVPVLSIEDALELFRRLLAV